MWGISFKILLTMAAEVLTSAVHDQTLCGYAEYENSCKEDFDDNCGKKVTGSILLLENYLQKKKAVVICPNCNEQEKMNNTLKAFTACQQDMKINFIQEKPATWDILFALETEILLVMCYYPKFLKNVGMIMLYGYKNINGMCELFDVIQSVKYNPQIIILSKEISVSDIETCECFLRCKAETVLFMENQVTVKPAKSKSTIFFRESTIFSGSSKPNDARKTETQEEEKDSLCLDDNALQLGKEDKSNVVEARDLKDHQRSSIQSCESADEMESNYSSGHNGKRQDNELHEPAISEDEWATVTNLLSGLLTESSGTETTPSATTCSLQNESVPEPGHTEGVAGGSQEAGASQADFAEKFVQDGNEADMLSQTNCRLHQRMLDVIILKEKKHCACQNSIFKGLTSEAAVRDKHLNEMSEKKSEYVSSCSRVEKLIEKLTKK